MGDISNGICWCVIILAGMRLGYHVQGLAEKLSHAVLYEDFKIDSYNAGYMEWQSNWMNEQVAEDGKTDEANEVAQQIIKELGI